MALLTHSLTTRQQQKPASAARLAVRWLALHGIARFAVKRLAAGGDLQAMFIAGYAKDNPVALLERVRAGGPVNRTKLGYLTVDHAVVHQVLRSDDFRVISLGASLPAPLRKLELRARGDVLGPLQPPSLLATEPPDHTRYRTLVSSVFTARAVKGMRDDIAAIANELLDNLAGRDTVDLVETYCSQLPVAIICNILGVPEKDRPMVLKYGEMSAPALDFGLGYRQFVSVEHAIETLGVWMCGHLQELRRNPGNDLLSQLVVASEDGKRLNDDELLATAGLVLTAGFETTVNLLSNGIRLLLDNPDQLEILRQRPELWANAADEVLRMDPPVQVTARTAQNNTEVAGQRIGAGALVTVMLAGANRDPKVFPDPHRFDVTRENASKHLAFSGGRHFCLGAALARAEGEIGLRTLFERFPDMALAGPGQRRPTRVLRGWANLPVELHSAVPALHM